MTGIPTESSEGFIRTLSCCERQRTDRSTDRFTVAAERGGAYWKGPGRRPACRHVRNARKTINVLLVQSSLKWGQCVCVLFLPLSLFKFSHCCSPERDQWPLTSSVGPLCWVFWRRQERQAVTFDLHSRQKYLCWSGKYEQSDVFSAFSHRLILFMASQMTACKGQLRS